MLQSAAVVVSKLEHLCPRAGASRDVMGWTASAAKSVTLQGRTSRAAGTPALPVGSSILVMSAFAAVARFRIQRERANN